MTEKTKVSAAESIAGVMALVGHVAKDGKNTAQNFNFRGIDAVINAVGPALREVGGFFTPWVLKSTYEHGVTAKGSGTIEVRLRVEYSWYGTDGGEPIKSVVQAEATDMSDKATAKAMSVAERTYLIQILALPTDEKDPDEDYIDRGTGEVTKAPARATRTPAAPKGPTKPSKDWWLISAKTKTPEELAAVFEECRAAGELSIVCDYEPESGTANEWMRKLKAKRAEVAQPPADAPADDTPMWNVTEIPISPPTPDDAA